MTRTDVEASSRPQAAGTEVRRRGSSRAARRLMVLPVALLLAIALAAPTLAATSTSKEGLSGYGSKPSSGTSPNSGTSPSKSTKTPTTGNTPAPANEPAPATSSSTPTTTTSPARSSSLPFTGFNLSWTVGGGLLLIAMGFSIVTVQRRQGRHSSSR
jgi:hypothetical protein